MAYFHAPPAWFAWDYALATLAALAGAVALLMRSRISVPLYALSLVGVVIQFGYVFAGTDLLAHKGAAATVPFPLFIALMGVVQIVLARMAAKAGASIPAWLAKAYQGLDADVETRRIVAAAVLADQVQLVD